MKRVETVKKDLAQLDTPEASKDEEFNFEELFETELGVESNKRASKDPAASRRIDHPRSPAQAIPSPMARVPQQQQLTLFGQASFVQPLDGVGDQTFLEQVMARSPE